MGTNKNVVVSFSIAILLLLSLLLLLTYNSKCNNSQNNKVMTEGYSVNNYSNVPEPFYIEKFSSDANQATHTVEPFNSTNVINPSVSENGQSRPVGPAGPVGPVRQAGPAGPSSPAGSAGPSGSMRGDSTFQEVTSDNAGGYSSYSDNNEQAFKSCFPRDRLTADDLLPKDAADSKWARINPSGGGNIGDQNYLTAGYHVGVNTVGQSLRNANLQLRSEIPNPQYAAGPWMISTIEPDLRQNTLEIGSSVTYGGSSSY